MATLVLGPLEEEIAACRDNLSDRQDSRWRGYVLSVGRFGTSRVAVAGSGVGKTMSALTTQHWIDALGPERVLFVGTAGALRPGIEIGDVVVASEALQYDLDARDAGLELGRVPHTDYRFIRSDGRLLSAALSYDAHGFSITRGRILTGDRVIAHHASGLREHLVSVMGGDVVEMEGASAGLVCLVNEVPFLLLRVVSDRADGSAHSDFKRLLPIASRRILELVEHILAVVDADVRHSRERSDGKEG